MTHRDNVVVITSPLGSSSILLYDVDAGTTTSVDAPHGGTLYEFVSRDEVSELWLVEDGLWRLDYEDAQYENVPLGFSPHHVNRLPGRDLLVLDDPTLVRLACFDPDRRSVIWSVNLPTPDRRRRRRISAAQRRHPPSEESAAAFRLPVHMRRASSSTPPWS